MNRKRTVLLNCPATTVAAIVAIYSWIGLPPSQAFEQPPITAMAHAPKAAIVVIGSQAGAQLLSFPSLEHLKRIPTQLEHVHDLSFNHDESRLLIAGGSPGASGAVELWSYPELNLLHTFGDHEDLVYRVGWSPDSLQLCSASADGSCCVHDVEHKKLVTRFVGHSKPVLSARFLNDGTVVSLGADQTIQVWESTSGETLKVLDNHVGTVLDAVARTSSLTSRQIELVSISEDRTVRFWHPLSGRLVRFAKLPAIAQSVQWSFDGSRVIVGCRDGAVRIIDPTTATVEEEFGGEIGRVYELVCCESGQIILAGQGGIKLLNSRH